MFGSSAGTRQIQHAQGEYEITFFATRGEGIKGILPGSVASIVCNDLEIADFAFVNIWNLSTQ